MDIKESVADSYLRNSFRIPEQHYLLTDNLPSLQCQNVYLAPIDVYNFLQKKFDNIQFYRKTVIQNTFVQPPKSSSKKGIAIRNAFLILYYLS